MTRLQRQYSNDEEYALLWGFPRFTQSDRDLFFALTAPECEALEQRRSIRTKLHSHSNGTPDTVSQGQMPAYCRGEASAKFGQRPQSISTQPAIKDQGMYSVFGQFPPSGADPTLFICTFTAEGGVVGVDKE